MPQEPDQPFEQTGVQEESGGVPAAHQTKRRGGKSVAREWIETIVIALLVALVIRTFVIQVYKVEGESMEPNLHTNERLLVNKFVYWLRSPRPGEIVVLQDPDMPNRELIKRVIAVEGETVRIESGTVFINDKALSEPFVNQLNLDRRTMPPITIPQGKIFVMGDNRAVSWDSRALGPISVDKVDGKAFFMFWPLSHFAEGPLERPRVTTEAH